MVGRNSRPTFEECPAGACPPPCSAQDPFDASVCEFGSRSLPGNPKTPKFLAADCPACLSGFAFVRQSSWPLRFTCIRWWSNWQRLEPSEPSPQPWQWRRLSLQHYPSGQGRGSGPLCLLPTLRFKWRPHQFVHALDVGDALLSLKERQRTPAVVDSRAESWEPLRWREMNRSLSWKEKKLVKPCPSLNSKKQICALLLLLMPPCFKLFVSCAWATTYPGSHYNPSAG